MNMAMAILLMKIMTVMVLVLVMSVPGGGLLKLHDYG